MGKSVIPKQDRRKRTLFDPRYVRDERRRSYRMALVLFWSILLYFFFQRHVISYGIVTDWSMSPTMTDGSYFLVNRYIYHLKKPRIGDIVIFQFNSNGDDWYVKRVIATENDTLLVRAGKVYVNGKLLTELYATGATYPNIGPLNIPEGTYYVMGDNRLYSEDSRVFGPINRSYIKGRITPGKLFALL